MLKLKDKNDIPCGLDVGYEICNTQSRLFLYAIRHDYDDNDFIKKYMESQFCNRKMDALYSHFQLMNAAYIMSYLLDEITPETSTKHYDENAIEWIGWMYRYLYEKEHKSLYPDAKIEYIKNFGREILVRYTTPQNAGKFCLTFAKHTMQTVVFNNSIIFDSLDEIAEYLVIQNAKKQSEGYRLFF